jgi:hypothetical protein
MGTHPNDVDVWALWRWTMISQKVWLFCYICLKAIRISSIDVTIFSLDVDMIMNTVKYDTNKRWVIQNLNQQEMGNLQLFEENSFERER